MGRQKRRSRQFRDSSKVIDMEQARAERQEKRNKNSAEGEPEKEVSPEISARQTSRRMKLRRRRQNRRRIVIAAVVLVGLMLVVSAGRIVMLKHELHQAEKQQKIYLEEKKQLEKEMAEIKDLDYLEEQARDQMRLIMPGETLYIFPEETTEE